MQAAQKKPVSRGNRMAVQGKEWTGMWQLDGMVTLINEPHRVIPIQRAVLGIVRPTNAENDTVQNKLPGPQPISIGRVHLPMLARGKWLVTEKSDGFRFKLCSMHTMNVCYDMFRK